MKRLLLTFTTLLVFAFAMSGVAQAIEWGDKMFDVTAGSHKTNGFSKLNYADGSSYDYTGDYAGNTYKDQSHQKSYMIFHNALEGDLYQTWANKTQPDDYKEVTSISYYHSTYFRMYNPKGNSANALTGGTLSLDFTVKNTAKGAVAQSVGADIDFHWWEDPTSGTAWLVFTEIAWELGTITDANGVEYTLYLELKDHSTPEESAYTKLVGDTYNDVLAGIGLSGNPNLFAWSIADGKDMYMAFQLGAYGPGANPYSTPIPGAVWLMGTGVAGLIALRRRNR